MQGSSHSRSLVLARVSRGGVVQTLMKERGVSTEGLMEKADLVELATESFHLPVLEVEEELPKEAAAGRPAMDDKELDDMLKKLQMETGQGFKVFRPGDDMDDFLKSDGMPGRGKAKRATKKKPASDEL